jgi:spermidine synthase
VTSLEIDRWWQGEDRRNHQSVAASVPMLLHPDPRSVLVVGVGTGQTSARFLEQGVETLVAVDVEPAVFDVIREHFDAEWLDDPRVTRIADDGRHHVLHSQARHDIVSLELGQVFLPGVAACYTSEFYQRVRRGLAPGGIVCQFVPAAFLPPETFRRVVATFRSVFPQCLLWYNTSELLLLGTTAERFTLSRERLARLTTDAVLRDALDYAHWGGVEHRLHRPPVFVAGLLLGPDELTAFANGSEPLSDRRPVLEYAASTVPPDAELEAPLVELLRPHLADPGAVLDLPLLPEEQEELLATRELNLGDMIATARLRRVEAAIARADEAAVERLADEALRANPSSARALSLRGQARLAQGRLDEALSDLTAAVRLAHEDAATRRALAYTLHRQGRVAESLPHYQLARAALPDDAELHNNLGAAHAQLGQLETARELFEQALRLDPAHADARRNLQQLRGLLEGS